MNCQFFNSFFHHFDANFVKNRKMEPEVDCTNMNKCIELDPTETGMVHEIEFNTCVTLFQLCYSDVVNGAVSQILDFIREL